jgi:hypothetical protein
MAKTVEEQRAYNCAKSRKWREAHVEHHKQYNAKLQSARYWFGRAQKNGKPCIACGETDVTKLHFHHRDPATKRFKISTPGGHSEAVILAEIAKCDILCASCHAARHHELERLGS